MKKTDAFSPADFRLKRTLLGLVSLIVAASVGCARENKIYQDPPVTTTSEPAITVDGRAVLPTGFYNQSVNRAIVDVALDGVTASSKAIRLQTLPGSNDTGSFNGGGQGNRALLGLASHANAQLSSFAGNTAGITFDAKSIAGSESISVLLIVDLACDGTSIRVLNASAAALGIGTSVSDGYSRHSALFNEPRWKVNGTAITDPADASITLLPSSADAAATATSLDTFLAKYPSSCLKNVASNDPELPKNLPTASILFALGDASTITANSVFIRRLTVGSEVYEGLE